MVSLAIIAYTFGHGEMSGDVLKLPLVNVRFKNVEFITWMFWGAYLWFLYRYWLSTKEKGVNTIQMLNDEIISNRGNPILFWYMRISSESGHEDTRVIAYRDTSEEPALFGEYLKKITWKWNAKLAIERSYGDVTRDSQGFISVYGVVDAFSLIHNIGSTSRTEEVPSWVGIVVELRNAFLNPTFSNVLVPYVIAYVAGVAGLWRAG